MDVLSEFNEHVGYFGVYMGKNITFNDLLTSLYTLSVSDFTMNISSKTEFDNKDAEFVNKFIKDKIRTVIQRMVHLMDLYIRELKSSINQEQMDKFELNVWFDEAQHTFTTVKHPSNS